MPNSFTQCATCNVNAPTATSTASTSTTMTDLPLLAARVLVGNPTEIRIKNFAIYLIYTYLLNQKFDPKKIKGTSCVCPEGYTDTNSKYCLLTQQYPLQNCPPGQTQVLAQCEPCSLRCSQCAGSITQCTACDAALAFRTLVGNDCVCMDGFTEDSTQTTP